MKKVDFVPKPVHGSTMSVDKWVENRNTEVAEPTKRLTIDVSQSLHKRIRTQCLQEDRVMAEAIREILEKHFPVRSGKS